MDLASTEMAIGVEMCTEEQETHGDQQVTNTESGRADAMTCPRRSFGGQRKMRECVCVQLGALLWGQRRSLIRVQIFHVYRQSQRWAQQPQQPLRASGGRRPSGAFLPPGAARRGVAAQAERLGGAGVPHDCYF